MVKKKTKTHPLIIWGVLLFLLIQSGIFKPLSLSDTTGWLEYNPDKSISVICPRAISGSNELTCKVANMYLEVDEATCNSIKGTDWISGNMPPCIISSCVMFSQQYSPIELKTYVDGVESGANGGCISTGGGNCQCFEPGGYIPVGSVCYSRGSGVWRGPYDSPERMRAIGFPYYWVCEGASLGDNYMYVSSTGVVPKGSSVQFSMKWVPEGYEPITTTTTTVPEITTTTVPTPPQPSNILEMINNMFASIWNWIKTFLGWS